MQETVAKQAACWDLLGHILSTYMCDVKGFFPEMKLILRDRLSVARSDIFRALPNNDV